MCRRPGHSYRQKFDPGTPLETVFDPPNSWTRLPQSGGVPTKARTLNVLGSTCRFIWRICQATHGLYPLHPFGHRHYQLADHVDVTGANVENGLLDVDLVRNVPDRMKPRAIAITSSLDVKQLEASAA